MSQKRVHKILFCGHVIKTWAWFGHENRGQKFEKRPQGDGKGIWVCRFAMGFAQTKPIVDPQAWIRLFPIQSVCCDYLYEKPENLFDNIGKQACKRPSRHQVRIKKL